jgi:hypothetical protein
LEMVGNQQQWATFGVMATPMPGRKLVAAQRRNTSEPSLMIKTVLFFYVS